MHLFCSKKNLYIQTISHSNNKGRNPQRYPRLRATHGKRGAMQADQAHMLEGPVREVAFPLCR